MQEDCKKKERYNVSTRRRRHWGSLTCVLIVASFAGILLKAFLGSSNRHSVDGWMRQTSVEFLSGTSNRLGNSTKESKLVKFSLVSPIFSVRKGLV